MNRFFEELMESVQQMNEILRDERRYQSTSSRTLLLTSLSTPNHLSNLLTKKNPKPTTGKK